jgi:hypothetical protein
MRDQLRRGTRAAEEAPQGIDLSDLFVREVTPEIERQLSEVGINAEPQPTEEEMAEERRQQQVMAQFEAERNRPSVTPTANDALLEDLWSAPPDVSSHFL